MADGLVQRTLVLLTALLLLVPAAHAAGVRFQSGDVFAAVGRGVVKHFSPTGALLDTLNFGAGTFDTGMAFDASGSLYVTGFDANNVYKFDQKGNLLGTFGSGYNADPESIVFDRNGNAYVGQPDGTHQVLKFNSAGGLVGTFSPAPTNRGTDWVDLAADQCTLRYTSEGATIGQFNVCTNTQLPDFATGLAGPCYAHRIRPNFEELVACSRQVYRLNSSGGVMQVYALGASLFALNLDPDNKTFWTADYATGVVYRVDIASGAVLTSFNAGAAPFLGGLAVVGEITASTSNSPPPPTASYYVLTRNTTTLGAMGVAEAQRQLGNSADVVVALLFGGPTMTLDAANKPLYGASGWQKVSPLSLSEVTGLVQAYVIGFYNALGNNTKVHLRIVVGTSNSQVKAAFGSDQVNAVHGQAWGSMVNSLALWVFNNGYAGQVDIAGGFDAEPGYNTPAATKSWVNGYATVAQRFLYDLGDSGGKGCPPVCENQWTTEDLWYVSWGARPALPLPEIYRVNGQSATQWSQVSLYGYTQHNQNLIISGALTTHGTCQGQASCANIDNTPAQGWQQLYNALNADTRTAQTLPWSTDLSWSSQK